MDPNGEAKPPALTDPKPSMMSAIPRKKLPPLPSSSTDAIGGGAGSHDASASAVRGREPPPRPHGEKKLPFAAGRQDNPKHPPPLPPPAAPVARSSSLPSGPARHRLKKMRSVSSTQSSLAVSSSSVGSLEEVARAVVGGGFDPPRSRSAGSLASFNAPSHIVKVSSHPLVLRIRGVPMVLGIYDSLSQRPSLRIPKRTRPVYEEPNESDPDDYLPDDHEPRRKRNKAAEALASSDPGADDTMQADGNETKASAAFAGVPLDAVDAPPPGELSSLWYSREDKLHVFVAEKICGWKTRFAFGLFDEQGEPASLDGPKAIEIQSNLLQDEAIWAKRMFRMEISRIVPTRCPVVLTVASMLRDEAAVGTAATMVLNALLPADVKYVLKPLGQEEVLLVKWRGRSYLHCSWERPSDIARFDNSNNTAKNKMKRFYQQQEAVYGPDWKKVLQEEQSIHHVDATMQREIDKAADEEREDFFSPQNLEVERILGCDESTIDMRMLARQRGLNMTAEQEAMRRRELEISESNVVLTTAGTNAPFQVDSTDDGEKVKKTIQTMVKSLIDTGPKAWDPEDNVRYVVKWKGLPFADMTWEYWRDIKRDAVDEAEDFWHRQQPPDPDLAIRAATKAHPHMREFRKLQESPMYGVSSRTRPVEGFTVDEEEEATPGFCLRSYQLEGVNWLLFNWWNRRSPILADEMGLGKTIQTVAFLRELQTQRATQVNGPFLIVAPLSLVGQWQSELHSWAPDLNVVLYHGSADARDFLCRNEFFYTEQFVPKPTVAKLRKHHITKFHVLITTYEVVLKDVNVLSKIKWRCLIVDEAHRLKNSKSKLFDELATVPRDYCLLLTGTPIANATEELWALLNFANPSVFHDKEGFLEKFGSVTDANQVSELHTLLKPYLLRRVKDDVEKSLPPKEETILEVSLTPIQKTYYKAIYERNTSFLYKGAKPSNAPSLMNVMMELRKCCNHPYLVKGAEERILADAATKLKEASTENAGALSPSRSEPSNLFAEQLVKSSGKMVLMEKLLHKLFLDGHKVLVFSQMVRALDLLEELLKLKRYRYERLDGSTSSSSRAHAVDRFNRKSMQRFVMLLSTRAGGLGLNLTAADIVIIFDSDFNPQNDLQAMARAHRIGQTRAVQVFRLLTAKTYEMHMFHSASLKLGLERAVLSANREQADESDEKLVKSKNEREAQAKEIDELLKKGAYDVFRDDDDHEAEQFMETDIDNLLARSAKKVTYGAASTSSLGGGLGSFSKASFVANTDEGEKDVDLDDPDFWSKTVGLEAPVETSEEVAAMIDDGVKRSRKQVQVYDPYADTAEAEKMRKERLLLEKMMEREEKERLKEEKKRKKMEAKEKKRREKEEQRLKELAEKKAASAAAAAAVAAAAAAVVTSSPTAQEITQPPPEESETAVKKPVRETKPKKSKKSVRQRALRRLEYEDPVLERLKQAWEVPQRAKATAAAIRFGFNRFCKIRNESNLTSLPLQDLEIFVRSYIYQVTLQVAVILLVRLNENPDARELRPLFKEWLGVATAPELDWICDSVQSVMELQLDVEARRRFLRMPLILAEPTYVEVLRQGAGFRALRRIGFLDRLNRIIESCLDSILASLGHEELGKRGCAASELSTLDVDLKARYVTNEELALAISSRFRVLNGRDPASWWDRSCDIGLIVGTFVHGLGNYESMRNDFDLPFADKLRRVAQKDESCHNASHLFRVAAHAARKVFDDALEAVRVKAELEVQAAVAAAAKAASKREEDAALLRKGGAEAEVVASSMPDTQVENAFEFDGTDSHFVTLPRMHAFIRDTLRKEANSGMTLSGNSLSLENLAGSPHGDDIESQNDDVPSDRIREHQTVPMPDARVLDHRLLLILKELEYLEYGDGVLDTEEPNPDLWRKKDDVLTNLQVRALGLVRFFPDPEDRKNEYSGVGLGSNQCGTAHRTLNDGSDYAFGSASSMLSQVAYGTDAPRYLRAVGVPMNVTRFALSALVYAENSWVMSLIEHENLRFYGEAAPTKKLKEIKSFKDVKLGPELDRGPAADRSCAAAPLDKPLESSQEHQASSDVVVQIDPLERMPAVFRENAQLRANICLAVIYYGFPASFTDKPCIVSPDLLHFYQEKAGRFSTDDFTQSRLFDDDAFRQVVVSMAPDVDVPDTASIREYVEGFLLPHCLRFCINGNGPTTRAARGSQGEYETAFGVSLHPEPSEMHPSPLPDPCLSLQEHSMEALGQANAVLRRVRLLRTCMYIVGGGVSLVSLEGMMRLKIFRGSSIQDIPVWWCPWLHDICLVLQAATRGLFSVIPSRSNDDIFAPDVVQRSLVASLLEAKSNPTDASSAKFPAAVRHSTADELSAWAGIQAQRFPSLFQLERRMAFVCSHATVDIATDDRFDCVPMFDHGGWPRN